jgi:hypothetical protein
MAITARGKTLPLIALITLIRKIQNSVEIRSISVISGEVLSCLRLETSVPQAAPVFRDHDGVAGVGGIVLDGGHEAGAAGMKVDAVA